MIHIRIGWKGGAEMIQMLYRIVKCKLCAAREGKGLVFVATADVSSDDAHPVDLI